MFWSEDAGEGFAHDHRYAVDLQHPGGVLPGGSAAEIGPRHDHPGAPGLLSLGVEAGELEVFQYVGLQVCLGYFRQVARRNDFIGIDIVTVKK